MHSHEEEPLEPVARFFRFTNGQKFINKKNNFIIADLGCGPKIRFYKFLIDQGFNPKRYIAIDPLIQPSAIAKLSSSKKIIIKKSSLKKEVPLKNNSVDYVVGFAFLEHIDHPEKIINDAIRVIKKGGKVIFTIPSFKAKWILEFLSFKLGLISKREIAEHKNYFDKEKLISMIKNKKDLKIYHSYFEAGLNNVLVIEKNV